MTISECLRKNSLLNQNSTLEFIENKLLQHQNQIESWFRQKWRKTPAPFYSSVDLRNACFKITPVDTNLFPAGFNNLNPELLSLAVQALQGVIEKTCPTAKAILLIPENHTRNNFYFQSLATLFDMIYKAGYEVKIGSLREDIIVPTEIQLETGQSITLHPIQRKDNNLYINGWHPCSILLNNDLSSGRPAILENLEQPILPPLALGWSNRLKSNHFIEYKQIAEEFAKLLDIDPWLINPLATRCQSIDFMKRDGEDCLKDKVESLLKEIQTKYNEYGIKQEPFVYIKADAGTYGMGIMVVRNAEEVQALNRKQRTKMSSLKEGKSATHVLLQEGVPTYETWGEEKAVSEPVVYMIDHHVVGGFYRVHTGKQAHENLNAPGMQFYPIPFTQSCIMPDEHKAPDAEPNRYYAYGVIARLAALAAACEIAQEEKK